MTRGICAAALMALPFLLEAPSQAAESVNGRWAADLAFCGRFFSGPAESPLIVTDTAVRWSSDACRIGRVYKTGETVHLEAICWGDSGERTIPVSLRPHAGRLAVTWDRGAKGDLKRCP